MSKEKSCKCCKQIWYEDMLDKKLELCPNCYEYCKPLIDGLKIEYKRIADLQHKLKVAEIATKLACDYLNAVEGDELYELCKDIYNDNDYLMAKMNYFKEQAEKEIKGEKDE